MAERKVLNKWYPPDFDPSKLIKSRRPVLPNEEPKTTKRRGVVVRMMLPMSVRCTTCGNFLYIGTKFNMRKETVIGEEYLDIAIYRFYFKCSRCSGEITMKTDPKNSDYVCEYGATRNYEPWRDIESAESAMTKKRQFEEQGDAMKSLENRTYDSKREMEILDALDEVRCMNKRLADVDVEELIRQSYIRHGLTEREEEEWEEDDVAKFRELKRQKVDEEEDERKTEKREKVIIEKV